MVRHERAVIRPQPVSANGGRAPTAFGLYLQEALERYGWRFKSKFCRRADISNTYLEILLSGYNKERGTVLQPSPVLLRTLAQALTDDALEQEVEYAGMMDATGYLPKLSGFDELLQLDAHHRQRELAYLLRERQREALFAEVHAALTRLDALRLPPALEDEPPPEHSDK